MGDSMSNALTDVKATLDARIAEMFEAPDLTIPLPGQVLRRIEIWDDYGENEDVRPVMTDVADATIITSEVAGSDKHKVALDIDFPVTAIPSSTPGHSHLYIDKELTWEQYLILIAAFVKVGPVEEGYLGASEQRGFTSLRLPWIKKGMETFTLNGFSIRCKKCQKTPDMIDEYVSIARENDWQKKDGTPDADMAVRREEGTYNKETGRFYCTKCYIALGQPLGTA
jgi:hypothetical protein